MPFDPTYPATNAEIESAPMRAQFNGLKDLIDSVSGITQAEVVSITTLPPGQQAQAHVVVVNGTLRFTFEIPQGHRGCDGSDGIQGPSGNDGGPGPQGNDGPPGEVTNAQLASAIAGTSSNSNGVALLGLTVSDPPTQAEVQQIADKLDELINALRR
jgi:hypothetical protein